MRRSLLGGGALTFCSLLAFTPEGYSVRTSRKGGEEVQLPPFHKECSSNGNIYNRTIISLKPGDRKSIDRHSRKLLTISRMLSRSDKNSERGTGTRDEQRPDMEVKA